MKDKSIKFSDDYWELVEWLPKILPIYDDPGIKMDLRGIAEYMKRTGKSDRDLTDEEMAMFVDDVPKMNAFYDKYAKNIREYETARAARIARQTGQEQECR